MKKGTPVSFPAKGGTGKGVTITDEDGGYIIVALTELPALNNVGYDPLARFQVRELTDLSPPPAPEKK